MGNRAVCRREGVATRARAGASPGSRSPLLPLRDRSRPAGRWSRRVRPAVRFRRVEAGRRGGDEGPVAGAAVEDEAVLEDQADVARRQFGERGFGDVDREALVVVAVPDDLGLRGRRCCRRDRSRSAPARPSGARCCRPRRRRRAAGDAQRSDAVTTLSRPSSPPGTSPAFTSKVASGH